MPKTIAYPVRDALPTWTELNARLRGLKTERAVEELLADLRREMAPPRWLRRTMARLRKLRQQREIREFEARLAAKKGPRSKKEIV